MSNKQRETYLKIIVGAVVGLFLLDRIVLTPFAAAWKSQGERLTALRVKVQRGRQLVERGPALRARWDEMQRTDLPDDTSAAESDTFKAMGRWAADSRVGFTSLTPRQVSQDGYNTLEYRATATADQAAIGRLIYDIEADALPVRVEECELSARDAQGKLLSLSVRFSFLHIGGDGRNAR